MEGEHPNEYGEYDDTIGRDLTVNRMGYGAMRVTADGFGASFTIRNLNQLFCDGIANGRNELLSRPFTQEFLNVGVRPRRPSQARAHVLRIAYGKAYDW
jgi:hypothetical protein